MAIRFLQKIIRRFLVNMESKTTSKKTKVVGHEQYISVKTGAVEDFQVISIEERDANFRKIWLGHVISAIEEISNAKMQVVFFLVQESTLDNLVTLTIEEISHKTGISKPTIIATLKTLEKHNVIKRKTGVIIINPDVIFRGTHYHRMNILLKYKNVNEAKNTSHKEESSSEKKENAA